MSSTRCSNISKSPNKSSDVWVVPEDKLKILIRIRPVLNQEEETEFVQLQNQNTLLIKRPGNHTYMKFNNILPYYSTQKDVFNQLSESVAQFLTGTNITIFAYGQTGAGKTYSIIGNYSSSPNCSTSLSQGDKQNIYHLLSSEQRGILSRSLEMIMQAVQGRQGQKVWISFYEIYNQKIYDLYNKDGAGALDIRESKHGEISIPNLITIEITRIEEAIHYLMIGLKNRSTGSTHANAKSSRSHSIFQISMQFQGRTSSLRIVDLAGSQKFKIPSDLTALQKQIRIQQLTSINGSLSCLGHCISALIEKSRTHIPFRNSKLTRILSDSLLGHGKMRFIICISPSISASAQTFSTLQFANRAKRAIFDRSQMRTPHQMSKKKSQSQQIVNLRKQLQKQRQLRIQFQQQLTQTKKQNLILKIQNEKLKHRITQISSKAGEMTKSINNQKKGIKLMVESSRCGGQGANNYEQENDNNTDDPAILMMNDNNSDSHQQMLNLPIFQKNRQLIPNQSSSSVSTSSRMNKPINVKKAEFQKKIRKFIQQSSPENKDKIMCNNRVSPWKGNGGLGGKGNQDGVRPGAMRPISQNESSEKLREISRQQKKPQPSQQKLAVKDNRLCLISQTRPSHKQAYQPSNVFEQNQQQLDSLWQYHQQQTQQFFEKACQKMNMKQYQDLKQEMEKAKSELLRFKLMDDQIERKKVSVVR